MFVLLFLLNLLLCYAKVNKSPEEYSDDDFGTNLVASMRNDANLDISADEEYEDLRAELLAYHTALASITSGTSRRSMMSTPCWELGGICVDHKLCVGFRSLSEVPGCKDKLMVCCFAWNKFKVQDWRDKGLGSPVMPWSQQYEFGGLGVVIKDKKKLKIKKSKLKNMNKIKKRKKNKLSLAIINHGEDNETDEETENSEEIDGNQKIINYNKIFGDVGKDSKHFSNKYEHDKKDDSKSQKLNYVLDKAEAESENVELDNLETDHVTLNDKLDQSKAETGDITMEQEEEEEEPDTHIITKSNKSAKKSILNKVARINKGKPVALIVTATE